MEKTDIDKLAKQAIAYKNEEQFLKSIKLIEQILDKYSDYPKNNGLKVVLSGNYYEIKDYKKSILYADQIIKINPKVELAWILNYLSYYELDNHEKAFEILFGYLEQYPADLFKDTLTELLEGLSDGYGEEHKDRIILYSEKNNVPIPKELKDYN